MLFPLSLPNMIGLTIATITWIALIYGRKKIVLFTPDFTPEPFVSQPP
ncbi:hypothetical protein NIES4103_67810 [Nostoc sp. NIES-4103]|nr:hypothetical protein NIES4103_67810 [Nostoc sp. NIES-4103]